MRIFIGALIFLTAWMQSVFSFSCNDGPPGRYCTKDLSAYHHCKVVDGRLKDTVVSCPKSTRCTCFYGPSCSSSVADPCGAYVVPPIFNYSFTLRYHGKMTDIAPTGRFEKSTQGLWYQLIDGAKSKQAFTDWDVDMTKTVTVPSSKRGWTNYTSYSSGGFCTKQYLQKFPVHRVPWNFNKAGSKRILGTNTQRWKRVTGGQNSGSAKKIEYFYTAFDKSRGVIRPVRYTSVQSGLRSTRIVTHTVGLFYAKLAPYSMAHFRKPAYC